MSIQALGNNLAAASEHDGRADMSDVLNLAGTPSEVVIGGLSELVAKGHLLHGTNLARPFARIEPRAGNDLRPLGEEFGVYATDRPGLALALAIYNRNYLREQYGKFQYGWSLAGPVPIFKVDPAVYPILAEDPERIRDGYVYVVAREGFRQAYTGEYRNPQAVEPVLVARVDAGALAPMVLSNASGAICRFEPFSQGEVLQIRAMQTLL